MELKDFPAHILEDVIFDISADGKTIYVKSYKLVDYAPNGLPVPITSLQLAYLIRQINDLLSQECNHSIRELALLGIGL